jgi:NAD(P)-dependent dehydrogenase (short-subunit alcohol dehydrogenase family)
VKRRDSQRCRAVADRNRHDERQQPRKRGAIPVGRLDSSEEVAQVVLMVIGNSYMTGQTVQVNGGLHFN